MRFYYLSHCQPTKAQVSLCKCTDFQTELSLMTYTKYGCRKRFGLKFRPIAWLDTSVCWFKGEFCTYVLSIKSCVVAHMITIKPILNDHPKIDKTKVLKTDGS